MILFWRAVALGLVVFGSNCLGAETSTLEPQDGVLVLRNGFVLQGRITPVNEMFFVTMGANGEIRLPRSEVEFQCRDLDEAYLRQRDAMIVDEPSAHLTLADWCLRHRLLDRAADQLLIVYLQEPGHPRLQSLEQRLYSLISQSSPAPIDSTPRKDPAAPLSTTAPKLSPQLMQQFTTVVQPILLNRCAAYTCHGNGSSGKFRLIRPATGHATTSRVTQRNLQATQPFIDPQDPESSPLLAQGITPHGGAKSAPLNDKYAQQMEILAAWVRRAAITPPTAIATNSGGPKRRPARPTGISNNAIATDPQSASRTPSPTNRADSAVVPAAHAEPVTKPRSVTPAVLDNSSASNDPFDPEIFNQRYHPGRPALLKESR